MIGYGTPARRPCHKCTSVPHTSARSVFSKALAAGRSGRGNSRISIGWRGAGITAARMRSSTRVRYSVDVRRRIPFLLALTLCVSALPLSAQTYQPSKPRLHWVSLSLDSIYTEPLHFADHPLSDLLGKEVASTQGQEYEYRTRDDATLINVVEFSRRQRAVGVSLFPLGMNTGPALMLRGSYQPLPRIQLEFTGPAPFSRYAQIDAHALDLGAGVIMADRSPGWGLGSHAFVIGGIGKITSELLGDGGRYFAEGGGGLSVGPFGVELSVKFAWNSLDQPVPHKWLTVPVSLRGTFTF